jgi:hypothetical protein
MATGVLTTERGRGRRAPDTLVVASQPRYLSAFVSPLSPLLFGVDPGPTAPCAKTLNPKP